MATQGADSVNGPSQCPTTTNEPGWVRPQPTSELSVLLERSNASEAVRQLVAHLISTPPREPIAGSRRANTGYLASAKVGRYIQFNSRNYEYPAALRLEHDRRCIVYFAQAGPFRIERTDASGITRWTTYQPDYVGFFRPCEGDGSRPDVLFIQCKSEEELRKNPTMYTWSEGRWHDLEAERMLAATFGARHEIWTDLDFNETLIQNIRVLRPKLAAAGSVSDDIRERVIHLLQTAPGETLTKVRKALPDVAADHLHELILQAGISMRLDVDRLDFPDSVRLFACPAIALAIDFPATVDPLDALREISFRIGTDVRWFAREYRIANIATNSDGAEQILLSVDGSTVWIARDQLLKDAMARHFAVLTPQGESAMRYLANIKTDAESRQLAKNLVIVHRLMGGARPTNRHERRLAEVARVASADGVPLAKALAPKLKERGWFGPRMPDKDAALANKNEQVLEAQIALYAADMANPTIATHYGRYRDLAQKANCKPVSDETFRRRIAALSTRDVAEAHQGHRAANAVAPSQRSMSRIPTKAPRAHGLVLVDHTKVALMLVARRGARTYEVGRGWLTLAVCSHSTRGMAHEFLFDAPSTATLQLLARDYQKSYGRLPDAWAHDNGVEFKSNFWTLLNGNHGVDLMVHPLAHPRYGSEVELTFGGLDARLWNNILGGTKDVANRRRLTRDRDPQLLTPWDLGGGDQLVGRWMDTHNNTPLAGIGLTPNEIFDRSLEETGTAPERKIEPGRDWDAFSLPRPNKDGMLPVRRGEVTIKGVTYTSSELAELPDRTKVEVRFDPFDRSRAMACVNDVWVYLRASERYDFLKNISERDRRYASQEATKLLGKGADPDAFGAFMNEVIQKQDTLRAIHSSEQRTLLTSNGTLSQPTPAHSPEGDPEETFGGVTIAGVEQALALAASNA